MKKVTPLAIALFFFIHFSIYSQVIRFKSLSAKDGLLSNTVNVILQDSDGFMWLGTPAGLARYDGYEFLNFSYSPTDSLTLSNNYINCLVEDQAKNLWIGTHNGLNVLNLETYQITRVTSIFEKGIGSRPILSLCLSAKDNLWVGTEFMGLYNLDVNTYKYSRYQHSEQNPFSIIKNTVQSLLFHPKKGLLVGTINGLDILDMKTLEFKHVLKNELIQQVTFYRDSSIFIECPNPDNFKYILSGDNLVEKKNILEERCNKGRVELFVDGQENEWISIRDKGLIYYEKSKNKRHWLVYDKFDPQGISSNSNVCFYEDKLGNVWIGSFDAGVNIFERNTKPFFQVGDNYKSDGLQNNRVRSIYQDSEGDIWIGTKVKGALSKLNFENLSFTHYKHDPTDPTSISSDFIFCITEDRPGYLWVGTSEGLNLFDKKSGEASVLHLDSDNPTINEIYALCKVGDQLFIGTVFEGLYIYDTQKKIMDHRIHSEDPTTLTDDKIRVLYKDSKDNVWVGTVNGLSVYNLTTDKFQQFYYQSDSNSISDNHILCIQEDSKGNMWIGTGSGINRFNSNEDEFVIYSTEDGLSGNSVYGILEDDLGYLWISTNNGLSKFNPDTESFKNYNIHDGLQANEFSPYAYLKTKNGEMLFGGIKGFNIFHPQKIHEETTVPRVILTEFKLFNKRVKINGRNSPLKKHIGHTQELTLDHDQSVFTISYVALNSVTPKKSKYAYILEGFEDNWNEVGTKMEATYTNLDEGKYVFKVKATNSDGVWNSEEATLIINVMPPPWLTWWAYLFYFTLLVSLFLLYRHFTIKRIKEEKENEQNQQNLKFFINVSHEFRTPLTLILHPIRRMLQSNSLEESKEAAQNIYLSANKLMNLTNQLLDFRKIDVGGVSLNAVKVDIVSYSKKIFKLFEEVGYAKELTLRFNCSFPSMNIWLDPDKYEKILNNLLSNAIKFTPAGGQVILSIEKKQSSIKNSARSILNKNKSDDCLEIRVKDTGVGIPEAQIEHIFERFYSSDETPTGTGIGLHYSKSLVEMHAGMISVESTACNGSTFIIQLPIGNQHLKEEQISETEFDLNEHVFGKRHLESLQYDIDTRDKTTNHKNREEKEREHVGSRLPNILLVEDNKRLRQQLREDLENEYVISEAIDGEEGWEKAKKYIPDLIISDIMMPEMDGNELCQKIKNGRRTSHIPVILLTARIDDDQKVVGFESGADHYVTKPFNIDELHSRIKSLLIQRDNLKKIFRQKIDVKPSEITVTSIDERLISEALESVEKNISNPNYSVDELSGDLAMSRGQLYKKIVSLTGNTPSEFIRAIRLKRSAQLLRSSQLNISEISYAVGFKDPKYFTKIFKAEFKIPPSLFVSKETEGI